MNDYADRDFDLHVERTRNRPLAARRIAAWDDRGGRRFIRSRNSARFGS